MGHGGSVSKHEKANPRDSSSKNYDPIIKSYCLFCKSPHRGNSHITVDTKCTQCKSPLFPVEKMKTDKSSQRAVNRIEKHQEIRFFTYWPPQKTYKGQVRDLSPNGMRFYTDRQLSKDQVIKIDSNVLQAIGRVANRRKHSSDTQTMYGIGVEFVTLHFKRSHGTFVSVKA